MKLIYKDACSYPDLEESLKNDEPINNFIDRIDLDCKNWCIFANSKLFIRKNLNNYRKIDVVYSDFMTSDVIIFFNRRNNFYDSVNIE